MKEESDKARNTAAAISSGLPSLPIGWRACPHSLSARSRLPNSTAIDSAATPPGDNVLTRMSEGQDERLQRRGADAPRLDRDELPLVAGSGGAEKHLGSPGSNAQTLPERRR